MIRFAWLQSRDQTLIAAALVAALAVAAAITGIHLSHLYNAQCRTGCDGADPLVFPRYMFMWQSLNIVSQAAPALIGIFWGAPLLARELETGTYQLAWTQGVTRSRWLLTKLALSGLATVTIAGVLTLTITWWNRAPDKFGTTPDAVFDRRDIVPVAYALFAFASGALIGAITRRNLPTMAWTLGVFVVTRIAVTLWIRPHLPANSYWTLQWLETGVFTVLALTAAAGCYWWITRRAY
jgi:ABC-type transport system involved in multi-copper enzyme maturation permease subunit